MNHINEKTLVPISLVITIIMGVFFFAVGWSKISTNSDEIVKMRADSKDIDHKFDKILAEIYYLKGIIEKKER